MAALLQEVGRLCNTSGQQFSLPGRSEFPVQQTHASVYIIALVLGCTSLALSIACLLFNILSRNNRVVKMSSPRLNVVIASGGIVGSCACMMFSADYFLDVSSAIGHSVCQARASLLAVSFTLIFGPMVGKTWRVNQIFRLAGAKRVIIKDVRLVAFSTILLCIDVIWTLLWNFVDPLQFSSTLVFKKGTDIVSAFDMVSTDNGYLMFSNDSDALTSVSGCTSRWSSLWLAGMLLYKAPLLVWGLREAWWTRGHILPAINDSACLAYSTLSTGSAMVVYLFTVETFRKWPTIVDACAVISIWLCIMVAIALVFIPKVRVWRSTPKGERARVSISSISNSMAFLQSFENIESELGQAHSEIDSLKSFIRHKETDMDKLQHLLSNAETSLAQIQLGHPDLNIPKSSPKLPSEDRETRSGRKAKPKSTSSKSRSDENYDDDDDDGNDDDHHHERDGADRDDHQWSGNDGACTSSADEGGVTSEEVNSSIDNTGETDGHLCCLHGKDCQASAAIDKEKEEGSCWYLPSDRGYAPAHLLKSQRGRHHSHPRHHHYHSRRRRRPGLSTPAGHSFRGHRPVSSCGSSSVFTRGSGSNKNAMANINMYNHYLKRGGGVPARRHSHGSIYSQQPQSNLPHDQQHHLQLYQESYPSPHRLFEYSTVPIDRRLGSDSTSPGFLKTASCSSSPSKYHHYETHGLAMMSKSSRRCPDPDLPHHSRPRFPATKQRKRRRSSTPSVQSESSYTKLSKLRSDLSDAMAISRRLVGMWSVDSEPALAPNFPSSTTNSIASQTAAKQRRAESSRSQTVIGIQGIADSILESYNFQRTEDNHSFVYDCITPRRYTGSPSKASKPFSSDSNPNKNKGSGKAVNTVDNNANVFSFNFNSSSDIMAHDVQTMENGVHRYGEDFGNFDHSGRKYNSVEAINSYIPNNYNTTSFTNNLNNPPTTVIISEPQRRSPHSQNFANHPVTSERKFRQVHSPGMLKDKNLTAFYNTDRSSHFKDMDICKSDPSGEMRHHDQAIVFLPPQHVSIQSMVNQAHLDTAPGSVPGTATNDNSHINIATLKTHADDMHSNSSEGRDLYLHPGHNGSNLSRSEQLQLHTYNPQGHPGRLYPGGQTRRSPLTSCPESCAVLNERVHGGGSHSPSSRSNPEQLFHLREEGFSYTRPGLQCDEGMRRNDSFA